MTAIINQSPDTTTAQPDQAERREKILWIINKPAWMTREASPISAGDESIQVFSSVGAVDKKLLWIFEMVSSLSVILLAAGLITSQTNVQTHGDILSNHQWAQYAWAWTQNIAIDTSLLGSIIRAGVYWMEREHRKAILYSALSLVLLFTAFIVSNVEALYQSVHGLTLDTAWSHIPFVNVETLTSVRSFAIVLLLIAHAVQYVGWFAAKYRAQKTQSAQSAATQPESIATLVKPEEDKIEKLLTAMQAMNTAKPLESEEDKIEKLLKAMQTMNAQNLQAMQAANQQALRLTVEHITNVTIEAIQGSLATLPMVAMQQQAPQISGPAQLAASHEESAEKDTGEIEVITIHEEPGGTAKQQGYGEAIKTLLATRPDVTTADIVRETGCSERTARRWLSNASAVQQ